MISRLHSKDGGVVHSEMPDPHPPDAALFAWFRGAECAGGPLFNDISRAFDVRYLQPILYFLARTMHAKVIVEIGVADGSTTWPLVKAASEIEGGEVHSVDPSACEWAHELMRRTKPVAKWQHHQMTSDEFFAHHAPSVIDFAFVDGDHSCGGVKRDARNVLDRLVPGGIVVFHEWGPAPPFETIRNTPEEIIQDKPDRPLTSEECAYNNDACANGTQRALYQVLPDYDVDVMPLDFGACGNDRFEEWTEGGALVVRKRRCADEYRLIGKRRAEETLNAEPLGELGELEVSHALRRALANLPVATLNELCDRYSRDDLLKTRYFGRKSINELREILHEMSPRRDLRDMPVRTLPTIPALSDQDQMLLKSRYGIDSTKETPQQIAERTGTTRAAVYSRTRAAHNKIWLWARRHGVMVDRADGESNHQRDARITAAYFTILLECRE